MLQASMGAAAPAHLIGTNPRTARLLAEHRKLAQAAKNIIASTHRLVGLGEDPVVSQLLDAAGFAAVDVFVTRVAIDSKVVTAVCIPTRVWRDEDSRRLLLNIRRDARGLRTRVVIVPQRWLKADRRSSVARTLARSRHTRFSRKELRAVVAHLCETRISTLMQAAGALPHHDDPLGAVLAMACQGCIELDRSEPLNADTWTFLRL